MARQARHGPPNRALLAKLVCIEMCDRLVARIRDSWPNSDRRRRAVEWQQCRNRDDVLVLRAETNALDCDVRDCSGPSRLGCAGTGSGPGLSGQTDSADRAERSGRGHRHDRAADRGEAQPRAAPAGDRRQSRRRRRTDRRRAGRARAQGWLHIAARQRQHAHHGAGAVYRSQLRSDPRFRACFTRRLDRLSPRHPPLAAGEVDPRSRRPRQSEPGPHHLCEHRGGQPGPPGHRAAAVDDEREDGARALQRRGARDAVAPARRDVRHDQQLRHLVAASAREPRAGFGGDELAAHVARTGSADDRRDRPARFRAAAVLFHRRSGRHAGGNRAAPESGNGQEPADRGRARAWRAKVWRCR